MRALFHPGLFTAHDIWHQVIRFYYYSQSVNNGHLPPNWIYNLAKGFGYPLFFFSYHLPWLMGILILKVGLNFFDTLKILFFLSYLISGISMYFFMLNLVKDRVAALTSSILYLWLPYHFMVIFVGASMGIAFIFAFLPIVFWGITLISAENGLGVPILSLGLSGIILSHFMHLIFLFPIILIFSTWALANSPRKTVILKRISAGIFLAILISGFYLIPAYYYSKLTKVYTESGYSELYRRNFLNLTQLLYSRWGYGPIINNAKSSEISFQLGITQWLVLIIIIIMILTKKLSKSYTHLSLNLLFGFTIYIFLILDYSKFVWAFLVKLISLDFPFRLILPATFIATIFAGIILVNVQKRLRIILSIILILISLYTNRNHTKVNQYTIYPLKTYLDSELSITTNTFNEYLPIKADPKLLDKPWKEIFGMNLSFSNTKKGTDFIAFDVEIPYSQKVAFGQFYFPGQLLYVDNKIAQFDIDTRGLIATQLTPGPHTILIKYQETSLVKFSKILTLIGISIVFQFLIKQITIRRKAGF